MISIFVSVPILGKPELRHLYSLYQAIFTCPQYKIRLYFNENDSLISRVRNVHMSVFLDEYKEHDWFVSLDSDIEIVNCYPNNNIFKLNNRPPGRYYFKYCNDTIVTNCNDCENCIFVYFDVRD